MIEREKLIEKLKYESAPIVTTNENKMINRSTFTLKNSNKRIKKVDIPVKSMIPEYEIYPNLCKEKNVTKFSIKQSSFETKELKKNILDTESNEQVIMKENDKGFTLDEYLLNSMVKNNEHLPFYDYNGTKLDLSKFEKPKIEFIPTKKETSKYSKLKDAISPESISQLRFEFSVNLEVPEVFHLERNSGIHIKEREQISNTVNNIGMRPENGFVLDSTLKSSLLNERSNNKFDPTQIESQETTHKETVEHEEQPIVKDFEFSDHMIDSRYIQMKNEVPKKFIDKKGPLALITDLFGGFRKV